jgi:predicted glycogen debranching enzyme
VAALPAPHGRIMMLNDLSEQVRLKDDIMIRLGGEEREGGVKINGARYLTLFQLERGLPVWRYEINGSVLEKRIYMPYLQNTVYITYKLLSGHDGLLLQLQPAMHFISHEEPVNKPLSGPYPIMYMHGRYEVVTPDGLPPLRLKLVGGEGSFIVDEQVIHDVYYREEKYRGYEYLGNLWTPGYFWARLSAQEMVTLVVSTENWEMINALDPLPALESERERRWRLLNLADSRAKDDLGAELVLAADQFLIRPAGRVGDSVRAHAAGDEVRTVIAGYHWFTDWGRDTMISLEGLTLVTGRVREAGYILRTFAHYLQDGLIPNMFPEGSLSGLYHTADATLWFFHAVDRYVEVSNDYRTLELLLPELIASARAHLNGTRFGIHIDQADGLLSQGAPGYQLTWMDAKVGDWVVTPRRGKAVEINALWYNALRLLEKWTMALYQKSVAQEWHNLAEHMQASFNKRFWYENGGYLYDVIDGDNGHEPACRPNQIFTISLPYPVLFPERWEKVLEVVRKRLLTPKGLRSLAPDEPGYQNKYFGDLRARDAAYHQGTVWAWLIGPYIDAWLRVHPEDLTYARTLLKGLDLHLNEACIGQLSEVFDADDPFTARGCMAQAWSVAETLRAWVRTTPLQTIKTNSQVKDL